MKHTVTTWHGIVLHDAPVLVPLGIVVLALVAFVLVPLWIREVRRAEALADVAAVDAAAAAVPDVAA